MNQKWPVSGSSGIRELMIGNSMPLLTMTVIRKSRTSETRCIARDMVKRNRSFRACFHKVGASRGSGTY